MDSQYASQKNYAERPITVREEKQPRGIDARQGECLEGLNVTDTELHILLASINELQDQIAHVLCPESEQAPCRSDAPDAPYPQTEVGQRIRRNVDEIRALRFKVNGIISRVSI